MSDAVQTASTRVATASVVGRRSLRFESIDQVVADVQQLVEAEQAGRLRHLGNWSLGQTLHHLATWTEYGYTGSPLKPPFFIRWILRLRKQKFLYGPMRAGVKIPGVQGGTLATDPVPLADTLAHFLRVSKRLQTDSPMAPNPIFGSLTHQESIALYERHAELHLSFMVPQ